MKLSWGNWWKLCSISKNVNSSLSPPSHFHFPCSVCISRPALQSWGHLSLSLPRSFNISLKLDPSSFTRPTFHWPLVHFLIFILIFLKNMEFWEGGRVGWIEGAETSTPRKGWKGDLTTFQANMDPRHSPTQSWTTTTQPCLGVFF